ncbi:hypothetical protein SAMN02745165_03444 [Malonomonas rubra DSM 5091]|uniref:KfrA N-terminal DNA-binding domain-containing protein n=1 Tax=Malonomonas rubra DSM 5091 TaxID=1122189 RepID=A0A1M6MY71_MALRU|nr:DNA-binding protein [Malonomonas rubra]SHJ88417.1 hypothetical protein SAMN02745165_03444 [Malonomonas rubra DSM 5091]
MDMGITFEQVKRAMKHLHDLGERVSRRNVRAITGGGMSTVHRLMCLAEEQNALQDGLFANGISETFLNALRTEITTQLKSATENSKKQIDLLKARELEITEALSAAEEKAEALGKEVGQLRETKEKEQREAEKAQAVAEECIRRLGIWIDDYKAERKVLTEALETAQAENVRNKVRIEGFELDRCTTGKQTKGSCK